MSERKDLPPTTAVNFLERVKEELTVYMGNRGAPLEQAVRFKDLADGKLVTLSPAFLAGRGGGVQPSISGPGTAVVAPYVADLTPPPSVTGFTALSAISNLLLSTDAPVFTMGHGYLTTVLYGVTRAAGAPLPTFANAVEIARFVGTVYAYPTNPATTWHLWVKWMSVDGVLSEAPTGGINGVSTTTAADVTRLIAALTGPGNPFKVVTTSYTLADGTVVPVGTYTSDAYMGSFVAARGQIGLLAVDDARIANLQVSKLTAGSISVGEYIQSTGFLSGSSGWRINGNGVAEFSGVIVRGTVIATSGQIGGNTIDATGMQSPSYSAGLSGWRLDSTGIITAYSSAGANQFNLAATGTTPIIKVGSQFYVLGNGSAYFGGTLGANTVTAETIVSESIGKPFAFSSFPQPDSGAIGGGSLDSTAGMTPLLVIGPRNAVAGYLFGTASVSAAYLVSGHFGTVTTKLLVEEYTGLAGTGTVTVRDALYQTATAADSRVSGVNVYAMPVTVFAFALAADTKSVKITFSVRNNNSAQVAYLSNIAVAGAVLQR